MSYAGLARAAVNCKPKSLRRTASGFELIKETSRGETQTQLAEAEGVARRIHYQNPMNGLAFEARPHARQTHTERSIVALSRLAVRMLVVICSNLLLLCSVRVGDKEFYLFGAINIRKINRHHFD